MISNGTFPIVIIRSISVLALIPNIIAYQMAKMIKNISFISVLSNELMNTYKYNVFVML